jgi:hypothetical protein
MVVLEERFFPMKGTVRGKRRRETKSEVECQVNRDVEVEEMLDARGTSRVEKFAAKNDMRRITRLTAACIRGGETIDKFATRSEGTREAEASANADSRFGVGVEVARNVGRRFDGASFGSGVTDPSLGHGIDGDVVDDLLVERKARSVGVFKVDFRKFLCEGAAVVRRGCGLMLGDVVSKNRGKEITVV